MNKQWSADITITQSLVYHLLEKQFPNLAPLKVRAFAEGWDNALFLVNDIYVFRFPRRTIAVELLEMENRLLPILAQLLPVPIPNPQMIGLPTEEYPFVFSGYLKLGGQVPYKVKLTDQVRSESAVLWAKFLRTLHAVPAQDAVMQGIAATDNIGRMDVDKRRPLFAGKVAEAHGKGLIQSVHPLLQVLENLPSARDMLATGERVVVHGDLNFRNFLLDEKGRLSAVIDWGDAHIGQPAVDLSVVYSFLPISAREEFFRVYGDVESQTLHLAQFRALYTNLVILLYADDIGDLEQVEEAKRSLSLAIWGDSYKTI